MNFENSTISYSLRRQGLSLSSIRQFPVFCCKFSACTRQRRRKARRRSKIQQPATKRWRRWLEQEPEPTPRRRPSPHWSWRQRRGLHKKSSSCPWRWCRSAKTSRKTESSYRYRLGDAKMGVISLQPEEGLGECELVFIRQIWAVFGIKQLLFHGNMLWRCSCRGISSFPLIFYYERVFCWRLWTWRVQSSLHT